MLRIVLVLVALAAGGLAAWLALNAQTRSVDVQVADATAPVLRPATEVLVAATDLVQGQRLSEANVRWQAWPDAAGNASFIHRATTPGAIESLKGAVVRNHILAGEPVREDRLARADSGFLSAILPSGKRAVAVRVSAENTAGGFILPNDRVDVIHTVSQPGSAGEDEIVSRAILTNIRVLAIDQMADETKADSVVIGKTATLELDLAQAETIAAAEASGPLSLVLRSTADSNEVPSVAQATAGIVKIIRAGRSELVTR